MDDGIYPTDRQGSHAIRLASETRGDGETTRRLRRVIRGHQVTTPVLPEAAFYLNRLRVVYPAFAIPRICQNNMPLTEGCGRVIAVLTFTLVPETVTSLADEPPATFRLTHFAGDSATRRTG